MAVRSCTGPDGSPGYIWRVDGQTVETVCHTYAPGDEKGRQAALRLAVRDEVTAQGAVAEQTTVPLAR